MNAKELKKLARRSSGFTLVELLLVIAILATLATVVVVNVAGVGADAKINATRTSIGAIGSAIQTYEIKMGRFPNSLDDLTVETESSAALLKKDNLNDTWGTPFQYKKLTKYSYEIRSAGPDAQFNTEDDITN